MKKRIKHIKKRLVKSALLKDSFWALTGNAAGKGLSLLASILIARFLGKDLFGMYGLIRTTLLTIAVFSTFGFGYTATKFIAEYSKNASDKVRSTVKIIMQITLITSTCFAIIVFVFSNQISAYLRMPELYSSIRYLAIIIIFNSITTTQIGILSGFQKFKALARINLLNGVITFVLSVVLTYYYSLNGALIALLISQIYNCAQNYNEVRKTLHSYNIENNNKSTTRELMLFSLPVALQEMLYSVTTLILPVLLIRLSSPGEVGLFNAAQQWSAVILFIPSTLRNVTFSYVASNAKSLNAQNLIVKRMILLNFVSTFIPFVVVVALSDIIVGTYGYTFIGLNIILNISVFTTIFTCMTSVIQKYLIARNMTWLTLIYEVAINILVIGLFLIFNKTYSEGAISLVLSRVIVSGLFFIVYIFTFKYFSKTNVC